MDLSIKIIQESEEYQVIIEGDGLTRIIKARTIDELIKSLNNEIRELLTAREDTESLKASPCVLRGKTTYHEIARYCGIPRQE